MEEIKGQTYADGATVDVDGRTFSDCKFESATLRYCGGAHPIFNNCDFGGANWHFSDGALRTIQLLQQINASPGGDRFLADLFKPGIYFVDE
jgi:uncharacterized protein YjbI with pentapeptide repeats